jgi:pantoate--beta-alanine ligase
VSTICTKLFHIVEPNEVFFGQKDGIQCILINRLIKELNFNIQMNICKTMREKDGLAMSNIF